MIRTDEGKELIKQLKDLTLEADDTGSYWNPDGGKKIKRTKKKGRKKKKGRTKKSKSKRTKNRKK